MEELGIGENTCKYIDIFNYSYIDMSVQASIDISLMIGQQARRIARLPLKNLIRSILHITSGGTSLVAATR